MFRDGAVTSTPSAAAARGEMAGRTGGHLDELGAGRDSKHGLKEGKRLLDAIGRERKPKLTRVTAADWLLFGNTAPAYSKTAQPTSQIDVTPFTKKAAVPRTLTRHTHR
jgi:hypothetical protein